MKQLRQSNNELLATDRRDDLGARQVSANRAFKPTPTRMTVRIDTDGRQVAAFEP